MPSDFVEGQGKGLLCAGYHLDELARGVAGLQSTCRWLGHERLLQTQLLAQTMVKHLGELATLMEGPNTSEWDKVSRKLQRAHKRAELSKEVNAVSKERDDVAESLKRFVFKTLRLYEIACTVEQEWLGVHKAGAAFHGCTVCLINTAQVLGDIVDSLLQMADYVNPRTTTTLLVFRAIYPNLRRRYSGCRVYPCRPGRSFTYSRNGVAFQALKDVEYTL